MSFMDHFCFLYNLMEPKLFPLCFCCSVKVECCSDDDDYINICTGIFSKLFWILIQLHIFNFFLLLIPDVRTELNVFQLLYDSFVIETFPQVKPNRKLQHLYLIYWDKKTKMFLPTFC